MYINTLHIEITYANVRIAIGVKKNQGLTMFTTMNYTLLEIKSQNMFGTNFCVTSCTKT